MPTRKANDVLVACCTQRKDGYSSSRQPRREAGARTQPIHFTCEGAWPPASAMCLRRTAAAPMMDANDTTYAMKSQKRCRQYDALSNASYPPREDLHRGAYESGGAIG